MSAKEKPKRPKLEWGNPADLEPDPRNPRTHDEAQLRQLRASMEEFGFTNPILLRGDSQIIGAGHGRRAAALLEPPMDSVSFIRLHGLSEAQWRALQIADNQLALNAGWDFELLAGELEALGAEGFDISILGFDADWMDDLLHPKEPEPPSGTSGLGSLSERFLAVPFSVLNSREGWWQERKRQWLDFGIESEEGRDANLLGMSDTILENSGGSGTSIFDPVLSELAIRWWSPPEGRVLDPFAGGSVRGIVAAKLGRSYMGIDLRPEQIEANRQQATLILGEEEFERAQWEEGDSFKLLAEAEKPAADFDFIFTCPPYGNLERYSERKDDLSNMPPKEFERRYRAIIHGAMERLAQHRFAAIVAGDYREGGFLQDFVSLTIDAFHAAGGQLYNHAILITPAGNVAMRAGRTFAASRKLGTTHQHLLVFCKGSWKKACQACGPVEIDADAMAEAEDEELGDPSAGFELAGEI